jgi:hypothetical protein
MAVKMRWLCCLLALVLPTLPARALSPGEAAVLYGGSGAPVVAGSVLGSPECNEGTAGTTCANASLAVTAGDVLAVGTYACAVSCGSATPPTISSISGTGLSGCVQFTGASVNGADFYDTEWWCCNVTATETATPTVTWSGNGEYGGNGLVDIKNSPRCPAVDERVGNGASNTTGTAMTVSTNGAMTAPSLVLYLAASNAVSITFAPLWTQLWYSASNGFGAQYTITPNSGTGSSTATQASSTDWAAALAALQ